MLPEVIRLINTQSLENIRGSDRGTEHTERRTAVSAPCRSLKVTYANLDRSASLYKRGKKKSKGDEEQTSFFFNVKKKRFLNLNFRVKQSANLRVSG